MPPHSLLALVSLLVLIPAQSSAAPPIGGTASHQSKVQAAIQPTVDPRVELLSIIARLAGYEEYQTHANPAYEKDIHAHFDRHANHPLIAYTRRIRQTHGISHDAVMSMAVSLTPPPELAPRLPLSALGTPRWNKEISEQFIKLLKDFYQTARCEEFFKGQASRYKYAEATLPALFSSFDTDWYSRFYGDRTPKNFHIILGLGNQAHSYGIKLETPGAPESIYAIMGIHRLDSAGNYILAPATATSDETRLLVHEFNHSFINPAIAKHEKLLSPAGKALLAEVAPLMPPAYRSWQTVLNESLVRAAVIRYMIAHQADKTQIDAEMNRQATEGFIWLPEIVDFLETYENNRKQYPRFENIIPLLTDTLNNAAAMMARYPKVISLGEFENGNLEVSPDLAQITIRFSKPMNPAAGISIYCGTQGMSHFPPMDISASSYSPDGKSFTMKWKKGEKLKPNFDYSFLLKGERFKSRDGYPLMNYPVSFRTSQQ